MHSPITIGTSTTLTATNFPPKRKTLAIGLYYFQFYSDGVNMGYRTRLISGGVWSGFTAIRACISGDMFSVRYYNYLGQDYVYYSYSIGLTNNALKFCRGTVAGALIAWGAEVDAAVATLLYSYRYPDVEVADDGDVFVGHCRTLANGLSHDCRVSRNAFNDGSGPWSATLLYSGAAGVGSDYWNVGLVRLQNTRVYCAASFGTVDLALKGWLYDFATGGWGAQENIDTEGALVYIPYLKKFGMVANGDDVAVGFTEDVTYNKLFRYRTYATSTWESYETIFNAGGSSSYDGAVHLGIDLTTSKYVAIWVRDGRTPNSKIQYCIRSASVWGSVVTWITNESDIGKDSISIMEQALNSRFGVAWTAQELSPYNVRWDELNLAPPAVKAGLHPSKVLPLILDG